MGTYNFEILGLKEIHEVSKLDKVMQLIGEGCIFLDVVQRDMKEFYVLGRPEA